MGCNRRKENPCLEARGSKKSHSLALSAIDFLFVFLEPGWGGIIVFYSCAMTCRKEQYQ